MQKPDPSNQTMVCTSTDPADNADVDGDGVPACLDCDDDNPAVLPGAIEVCNGIDDDCDGIIDLDADGVALCGFEGPVLTAIDVLLVIDNSCSMWEEQQRLQAGLSSVTTPFYEDGVLFHIGVVSTDMMASTDEGKLVSSLGRRWVDSWMTEQDAAAFIDTAVVMGTQGSANEQGLDAADAALTVHAVPGGFNDGFLRTRADLAILVLSDEDDHSTQTAAVFAGWLGGFKPAGVGISFHSIVSPNPVCTDAGEPGTTYVQVTNAIGGLFESICAQDYTQALASLGTDYSPAGRVAVLLPEEPDMTSIQVAVTETDGVTTELGPVDLAWDDSEGVLWFTSHVAGEGAVATVDYRPAR